MLKKYYIIFVLLFFKSLNAQIITIPDANFKSKLLASDSNNNFAKDILGNSIPIDSNNNGEIEVSEALNVYSLNVSNNALPNLISDLTGISYFSNLTSLDCSFNQLTSLILNVNNSNLLELNCSDNQISTLNILSLHNLTKLDCGSNLLTNVVVYNPIILNYLDYSGNQIPNLNLQQFPNLEYLGCGGNQIQSLNLSGLNNLLTLDCSYNLLQNLNVSNLTHLQSLRSDYNQLQNLDLVNNTNLQIFYCKNNVLNNLTLPDNSNLELHVYISNNALSQLNITNVKTLVCNNNQLTNLNFIYPSTLNRLECQYNLLTELDLGLCNRFQMECVNCSNNPFLRHLNIKNGLKNLQNITLPNSQTGLRFENCPQLNYICIDDIFLEQNLVQTLINQYGYTNCNYNSYCSFTPGGTYYTINGATKFDIDNNGCDVSDINYPNLKLSISDGTNNVNAIANISGNYVLPVQAGTYTITPIIENPNYFNVSPSIATYTFPSNSNSVNQDFCISPNGNHNDLEIILLPINLALPGNDVNYKIIYKNKGTTIQSGTISLDFNDAILDLISTLPNVTNQSVNNVTWSFNNLLPFESREINITLNLNSPTEIPAVNLGDLLNYSITINGLIDETPNDNIATLNQIVVNSFDPNNKTCLEGFEIAPDLIGQYIHYIIHFENTGSANAQNIVVKDLIDSTKYDVSTLIPLSGSSYFTTRIIDNKVEFIFQEINLPYASGSNNGYVAFKIKTKSTLIVGDSFSNTANIYFDYNYPITTNTTTTNVVSLSNSDFSNNNYIQLSPVPTDSVLNINTKDNNIISSAGIYNNLGQLVIIITNPGKSIDVSTLKKGTYFIKLVSDKGTSNLKFIKE